MSKYGEIFDKDLLEKGKYKPEIDRYFYMTMAEISQSLIYRNVAPKKDKEWRYTFRP